MPHESAAQSQSQNRQSSIVNWDVGSVGFEYHPHCGDLRPSDYESPALFGTDKLVKSELDPTEEKLNKEAKVQGLGWTYLFAFPLLMIRNLITHRDC